MSVYSVRTSRGDGEAEIEIMLTATIPGGRPLHRVSAGEIPDDIARALCDWLDGAR